MWVFPGGRVDPPTPTRTRQATSWLRPAGPPVVRRSEEAGLELDAGRARALRALDAAAHRAQRFSTWFFGRALARAMSSSTAARSTSTPGCPRRRARSPRAGELQLAPPTWVTLCTSSATYDDVDDALDAARAPRAGALRDPTAADRRRRGAHLARRRRLRDGVDAPGARHRLWMVDGGWRYERTP